MPLIIASEKDIRDIAIVLIDVLSADALPVVQQKVEQLTLKKDEARAHQWQRVADEITRLGSRQE